MGDVAGREATVKACGVAVARMLGHNWVPIPSKGSGTNVGTIRLCRRCVAASDAAEG